MSVDDMLSARKNDKQPRERGRPLALSEDHREHIIDALLSNWARYARGWPDDTGCKTMRYPDVGGDDDQEASNILPVDVDAAQDMECVMVVMRARRQRLWMVAKFRYLARYTDQTGAKALNITVPEYRATLRRVFAWVDARLERSALDA